MSSDDASDQNTLSRFTEKYKEKAQVYFNLRSFKSAQFLADKVVTLTNDPKDIFLLAKSYYLGEKYHQAISAIEGCGAEKTSLHCRYMLAKCKYAVKDLPEALSILNNEGLNPKIHQNVFSPTEYICSEFKPIPSLNKLYSTILVLRGRIFQESDSRRNAALCYMEALRLDIYNYEALEILTENHLLTVIEFEELMESLPWDNKVPMSVITKGLYNFFLNPHFFNRKPDTRVFSLVPKLKFSVDVMISEAMCSFIKCNYSECYNITERVLRKEKCNPKCLPLQAYCLMELNETNKLFRLGNFLLEHFANSFATWLVIGCYYYMTGKQDMARRCFNKAILKNPVYGISWLMYGHSFAADNEHDQALTSYFKANDLMLGSHVPLLYIGLECGRNNNLDIANRFLRDAVSLGWGDPFLFHELAVVAYQSKKFTEAEFCCTQAVNLIKGYKEPILSCKWEPLFNNFGHVSRKLKKYSKALEYHRQALLLKPLTASTLAYIGLNQFYLNNNDDGIESLHRSLALDSKDSFAVTILTFMMDYMKDDEPELMQTGMKISVNSFMPVGLDVATANIYESLLYRGDDKCFGNDESEENSPMEVVTDNNGNIGNDNSNVDADDDDDESDDASSDDSIYD